MKNFETTGGAVRFGLMGPFIPGLITTGPFLRDYVATLESCGVDSIWTVEHVVVAANYDPKYPYSQSGRMGGEPGTVVMPDPLELLSYMAAASETVHLCTSVVVAPLHSPTVLAKRVATLAALSGGRVELGVGIGWQREEYEACGAEFSQRGARLEESISVMRTLWKTRPAQFSGEFTKFGPLYCDPQPPGGAVPIILGGHSDPAVERAGRIGDGWFPFTIAPEEFEGQMAKLRSASHAAGRQNDAVCVTAWPQSFNKEATFSYEIHRRYVEAGASRIVVGLPIYTKKDLPLLVDQISRFRDEVADRL